MDFTRWLLTILIILCKQITNAAKIGNEHT